MDKETVPFGRPIGELVLALIVITFGVWVLMRPGLQPGLRVITAFVLAIAVVCGILALIDSVRGRTPGERR